VVKGTNIFAILALGIVPLVMAVGCDFLQQKPSRSEEEIIAEFQAQQAQQAEQERVAKLEADLAEMKEQQAANEAQLATANARADQAAREAKAAREATPAQQPDRSRRGEGGGGGSQQAARSSVVNVPQGTQLAVSTSGDISTDTHKAGDTWEGRLAQDVVANGETIWRSGARVAGVVSQSTPTGRLTNGEGALAIRLTEVGGAGIDGGTYVVTGDAKGKRNAKVIGSTAALGALAGILSSKNHKSDHALGGAAMGAAVGTALAAGSANTVIKIPASTAITFHLPAAERVVVKSR